MLERICVQCGKKFKIEDSEIDFYNKKDLNLPKRCKECRDKNKNSNDKSELKKETSNKSENIKLNNKKNNNLWKIIIASIVVIIGLFEGGANYYSSLHSNKNNSTVQKNTSTSENKQNQDKSLIYEFRTAKDCADHFKKHGNEFGYKTEQQYLEGANRVINSSDSLHKKEKEDGDDVYYLKDSNEFVIVSTTGYIRTYFKPDDGIAYYNRQ
ncbi:MULTISPECIES: zinc-ribbon domain containing protein [Clostridium]|uniref:zinc-ribbon domain containing protein n=1 Tax=Clostridium TaxID=1485 RepID=UPI0005FB21A9|nr:MULTISPECIES: zinc-ribbon domain containing protein [Clostridium]MDU1005146.1 zinc-ribbon domain containing protein [Clostridium butyricum]MDU5723758.1 zinc-ribbon domain containing protein [Clostridium butyricum]MDU5821356.1 zinc-ribbon domain containing protein [Clostridium butyricum]